MSLSGKGGGGGREKGAIQHTVSGETELSVNFACLERRRLVHHKFSLHA